MAEAEVHTGKKNGNSGGVTLPLWLLIALALGDPAAMVGGKLVPGLGESQVARLDEKTASLQEEVRILRQDRETLATKADISGIKDEIKQLREVLMNQRGR